MVLTHAETGRNLVKSGLESGGGGATFVMIRANLLFEVICRHAYFKWVSYGAILDQIKLNKEWGFATAS